MINASHERVMSALNFQGPDHVPHFDDYLNKFIERWKNGKAVRRKPLNKFRLLLNWEKMVG